MMLDPTSQGAPEIAAADMLVRREAFLPMSLAQLARRFPSGEETTNSSQAADLLGGTAEQRREDSSERGASRWGLRYWVPDDEGIGYWDNFRPLGHTVLSVVHATYRQPTWVPVHGEDLFKLRILLSGRLLAEDGKVMMEGPSAGLSIHPRGKETGYFIAAGVETKLVILHCYPHALSEAMGLPEQDIPAELIHSAIVSGAAPRFRKLAVAPRIFDATLDMIRSRYEYCSSLRMNFLQAKCMELLCGVVNDMKTAELEQRAGAGLTARDLNRVLEARDYLSTHFCSPPSIPALARRVGVNQTKLKSSFRMTMGTTLHAFVQDIRMRKASEMLLKGDHTIAEVAYAVGYEHAANFTGAFKKYYGFLPSALKPRR